MQRLLYLLIVYGFIFSTSAQAFSVNPTKLEIKPDAKNPSGVFQIQNGDSGDVSINVFMQRIEFDKNGEPILTPIEDKEFLIFPSQITVKANDIATVRVIYNGKKDLKKEASYKLKFATITPKFIEKMSDSSRDKGQKIASKLGVLLVMALNVFITPEKTEAKVMASLERENDSTFLVLRNIGTKRLQLNTKQIVIRDEGAPIVLKDIFRKKKTLMAGEKAKIKLKLPRALKQKNPAVSIEEI